MVECGEGGRGEEEDEERLSEESSPGEDGEEDTVFGGGWTVGETVLLGGEREEGMSGMVS